MIPFKEVTHAETGVKQRINWDRTRAMAKYKEMRDAKAAMLNARDIERARAAEVDIPEGATMLSTMVADRDGNMVIDPIASKVKHSGAELNDLVIPEWQEFCSKPQNDDGVEYPMPTYKPKQAVEIASPVIATPVEEPRRRPGRPRKGILASV